LKSAIASRGGGYTENTGMGSLDYRHKTLSKFIPEVKREDVVHGACNVVCPVRALYGSPGYHTNNGVYLASVGEVVYALCPSCSFTGAQQSKKKKQALVEIVEGTEASGHPWVVYTEQAYTRLVTMASTPQKTTAEKKRKAAT
jgi:hypothetical protein